LQAITKDVIIYYSMSSSITCPAGVVAGSLQTKEQRHEQFGKVDGGGGTTRMEKYQRAQVVEGTGAPCPKTDVRINWRKNIMEANANPMTKVDGYDWTEDFDGLQTINSKKVYVNFKSVVGKGGSQTRTLRDECNPFINHQLNYLLKTETTDCFFANIFDGDEAGANMPKFHYMLGLPEFAAVRPYVYVGDLKGYFPWLKTAVC